MFISIAFDFIAQETEKEIIQLLTQYGIKKVYPNLFESFDFPLAKLGNLKRDISNLLDMDDKLRIYQYPIDNSLKISYILERKWKRLSFFQ